MYCVESSGSTSRSPPRTRSVSRERGAIRKSRPPLSHSVRTSSISSKLTLMRPMFPRGPRQWVLATISTRSSPTPVITNGPFPINAAGSCQPAPRAST